MNGSVNHRDLEGNRFVRSTAFVTCAAGVMLLGLVVIASAEPASQPGGAASTDWPQWRGPNRDGIAPTGPKLLDAWPKEGPPLLWKSDFIPAFRDGGCGSPVVADGRVFVYANKQPVGGGNGFKFITAQTLDQLAKQGLSPEALARLSKLKDVSRTTCADWAAEFRGINGFSIAHHISISKPLRDLWEQAFVWSDTVVCLDAATGKEIWKKSFPVDPAVVKNNGIDWDVYDNLGVSSTPAVWGGKCYVSGSAGLYCLSARDGALLWQIKGRPEHASPLVANGRVYHCGAAYNAETGVLLWKNPLGIGTGASRYSSPLGWASGGKNYIITTDAAGNPRTHADVSSYCCLDPETGKVLWAFKACVVDNTIVHDDILVAPVGVNTPLSQAYRMTPAGTEVLWKGRFNTASWGGLVYQDHLYGEHGALWCVSMKTGEVNWKTGRDVLCPQVVADGKVFGVTADCYVESNPFGMFKATPEKYVELGRFNPQACTMCQPALVGGKLYLRLKDCLACYDLQDHGVYLDGVTAMKDTLTFRFKQTGGGLVAKADGGLKDIQITDAGGMAKPAQAKIEGDTVVVDVKDASVPFVISSGATNALAGKNGLPVPAFSWNESRLLKYRKAVDHTLVLKSDVPLQQVGPWDRAETFAIAGAKVTKVELDPQGKGVSLTTDKAWKAGDALTLTYPCFPADKGDSRHETLKTTVAEIQQPGARFVMTDTTTSGDWKGKYGAEGAMVAGDKGTTEAPKCAIVAIRNHQDEVPWAANPADPTKLQLTGKNPGRSITCWQAGDEIFLDIEITDGKEHQVAAYIALGGCPLSVEMLDADMKVVLDTQSDKGDIGNKYVVWNVKGNVTLHFASNAESAEGHVVRIGGLFFDPPAQTSK